MSIGATAQIAGLGTLLSYFTTPEMQHGLRRGVLTRSLRKQRAFGP